MCSGGQCYSYSVTKLHNLLLFVITVEEPLHLKYGIGLQVTRYIFSSKEVTSLLFIYSKNLCCFNMSFVQVFRNCYKITAGP